MKVLFFDIDGVLNDHKFNKVSMSNTLLDHCVEEFNRVIHTTGCKLVVSSAWRYMISGGAVALNGFGYMLRTHGVTEKAEIIGKTASDEEIENRNDQITVWVADHPEIEKWVAVDDLNLDLPAVNFVKTDEKVGLTPELADEIIRKLT